MDEFDEAVEVFGCDLQDVSGGHDGIICECNTYSIVLLVKVVHISVEYFDEQLH